MNRKSLYNILLAGFAALMVGWLVIKGPPSTANPSRVEEMPSDSQLLGIQPADVNWYELRDGSTGQRTLFQRTGSGEWVQRTVTQAVLAPQGELGAQIIAGLDLRRLVQFGPDDSLAQYGLTTIPQYVVSFEIKAYNSSEHERFTLYIGTLTPDMRDYYSVFVNEMVPDGPQRQGDWVYLIPSGYIETLFELTTIPTSSEDPQPSGTRMPELEP